MQCEQGATRRPSLSPRIAAALAAATLLLVANPARAVPAFARKYGTSCTTCHTVFPKLTPFGEAFRRNGFRFPGVDSDFTKQEPVSMGQDSYKDVFPNAMWPSKLPASAPFALGFNGAAVIHPDTESSAGAADNGAAFNLAGLVEEAQLFAAGSLSDSTTYFGELAVSEDGVEIEHAFLWFNDLLGPAHAVNLRVGKAAATLSSFGMHSTYVGDMGMTPLSVTAAFGGQSDSWAIMEPRPSLELNGVVNRRIDYALGLTSGTDADAYNSQDAYAQIGFKAGGMPMDGDEDPDANAARPWAETAFTFDVFGARSVSHFIDAADAEQKDTTMAIGCSARAQLDSLELNSGVDFEHHDHAVVGGASVNAISQWNELSYVVFPWLVPAIRVEYVRLSPDGGNTVSDLRILPGVAMAIFANIKVTVIGQLERASGAPDGGWEPVGGAAEPVSPTATLGMEAEAILVGLAYAY
jgi:thiol-disulfide isomerase/thioredoxin